MTSKRKSILKKTETQDDVLTPSKHITIEETDPNVRRSARKVKQNIRYFNEPFEVNSPTKESQREDEGSGLRKSLRTVKRNIRYFGDPVDVKSPTKEPQRRKEYEATRLRKSVRTVKQNKNYVNTFEITNPEKTTRRKKKENSDSESNESVEVSDSDENETSWEETANESNSNELSEELTEEDDNMDTKGPNLLFFEDEDVAGKDMYGFQTPKKRGSIVQRATELVNSPAFLTPKEKKTTQMPAKTPRSVRIKMKKEIARVIEENDSSDSDSDYKNSDDNEEIKIVKPKLTQKLAGTSRTLRTRRDMTYKMNTDEYFASHSTNKVITSNHTLQKLKNPKLSEDQLVELLNDVNLNASATHGIAIKDLFNQSCNEFQKWMSVLNEGFSVLVYGLGSKRNILTQFQKELLENKFPVIIVNGYFPSLTVKDVLDGIIIDLLEKSDNSSNVFECVNIIKEDFARMPNLQLYLIVHNIDGDMLRNNKSQNILANLAAVPNIHLVASIDHINTPLIWDHSKLSKFNFTWWDGTSFLPYSDETSFESSLLVQKSGALVLSSISSVYQSLTKNSKGIFSLIVKYQLSKKADKYYQGMPFKILYSQCRENFLVSSDLALRAQLTEFLDHKLVKSKRSGDGTELLMIPINNCILEQFSEEIDKY